MNRIRTNRLLIAGLTTFLAFIVLELLWEGMFGVLIIGDSLALWGGYPDVSRWTPGDQAVNLGIALVNCFMMIWLYASLRPMFGVGARTALIASAFVFVFVMAFELNYANLGFFPFKLVLIEAVSLFVELPLALIAGAQVYESGRWAVDDA
jgi:hypothetical protein